MRAIHTYAECTKITTDYWDIRPSVTISITSSLVSYKVIHTSIGFTLLKS